MIWHNRSLENILLGELIKDEININSELVSNSSLPFKKCCVYLHQDEDEDLKN